MLTRALHANGVVTYQSPLLAEVGGSGVVHAFSTRSGGVSGAPFDTLNLGNPAAGEPQDGEENLVENYRRLQEAIGAEGYPRAWVSQVHGRRVELFDREPENEYAETLEAEVRDRFSGQLAADAIVTTVPGVLLTIRVADCVPVLLASADGKVVAAVHAGWRGVVGNIAGKAVRAMGEAGVSPGQLVAAIGPSISLEHYEVGEEVSIAFFRADLSEAVSSRFGPKPHIDLQRALRMQLLRAGLAEGQIDGHDRCTFRDQAEFFSHRRDHGRTGRLAAVIAARNNS
jgi:polyphenol oxidase